jgi:hypothetical protein
VPERALRFALAAALSLSGVKLLEEPNSNVIVAATRIAGLAALAVWGLAQLLGREERTGNDEVPPGASASRAGVLSVALGPVDHVLA